MIANNKYIDSNLALKRVNINIAKLYLNKTTRYRTKIITILLMIIVCYRISINHSYRVYQVKIVSFMCNRINIYLPIIISKIWCKIKN
jgi:hypothetical protein